MLKQSHVALHARLDSTKKLLENERSFSKEQMNQMDSLREEHMLEIERLSDLIKSKVEKQQQERYTSAGLGDSRLDRSNDSTLSASDPRNTSHDEHTNHTTTRAVEGENSFSEDDAPEVAAEPDWVDGNDDSEDLVDSTSLSSNDYVWANGPV